MRIRSLQSRAGAAATPSGVAASVRSSVAASSRGSRRAASSQGMTPRQGQPVWRTMSRTPWSKRAGSPRSLLTAKLLIIAASAGSSTAFVPATAGDDPAAVDVREQAHRHLGAAGEAHVGDVACPQIGLRRASRPLDDHELVPARKALEALHHRREQPVPRRHVVGRSPGRGSRARAPPPGRSGRSGA